MGMFSVKSSDALDAFILVPKDCIKDEKFIKPGTRFRRN